MEPTPVSSSSDRLVLGMPLNGVNTLIACLHLPQEDLEYIYDKLSRRTQAGKDRTAQLAAAEARATEAAAEAGRWKAEAKAHAARFAVLEKADAAPYCEGQCGICDCITAPVAQPACSNCKHTDWEELAPGVGCNICQGL